MIWNVAELVSWVSEVMTLNPGDIIPSGCPAVDEINVGDTVEVEVESIGTLSNPVAADS
jgi:2-keto-4-pentenoate hydratase/2-oxohepta-3-ene-1,7-dioic acid hydratase in catechol pathway